MPKLAKPPPQKCGMCFFQEMKMVVILEES